ncbi:sacsin-like, partial [Arapaima gigas]
QPCASRAVLGECAGTSAPQPNERERAAGTRSGRTMAAPPQRRLPRVTVLHEYIGHRVFEVPPSAAVRDVKQLIYEEADIPVEEQQLLHHGKALRDQVQIGTLVQAGSHEIFMTLQGKGLKGGGRFGQTTPPLVEFLKDILRRYPEGGQILKELIQNAEDAGATEVKFMYDETEYGQESLWSHEMAQYQGTALYVYNNAVFTAEDWNGIQEIARSRKRDDPLKVGRFGIGFNSVYHITDVPSIFSGDQIGMLDPHQTLFGPHESGQCWNLKSDLKEITELSDQFAPYFGLFGSSEKTIKDGNFPGTLFRFPLRIKSSQLSSNIYNKEKVLELFESFKADADTVLLFLKNVQEVSLHVRESDGTERVLFRVTAGENPDQKLERPSSLKALALAIDSYSNGVPGSEVTCATYQVNIEAQDETTKDTQRTTWLVCNGVGGRGMCGELDSLADDLKFIPTIGIALPLTLIDEDQGATPGFLGRAFCFLPLPPGEESMTGLPVHVSGFFGLTDNRRSIKWREVDQWRDPAALWNELLIVTVIPRAYFTLIMEVIRRIQNKKDQEFPLSARGSYGAWPDPGKIRPRWKPILEPLFRDLLQQAVIYSVTDIWMSVDEAVFSELDDSEESTEAVLCYLLSSGIQVAKVPAAVDAVLTRYIAAPRAVKKVTPALVRQVLRKARHKGPSREKLLLLEFVLGDVCYSDLIGLELLPLQNETFTAFSSSVNDKDAVYIASEEFPRSLYPGLEGRFVLESIKPSVMTSLKEAAKSRGRPCTQVLVLTPERSARLIKEILTTAWPSRDFTVLWTPGNQEKQHPSVPWLKMVWKHLYINFPDDLAIFEDMPLIPSVPLEDAMTSVELLRLRSPSPIVLVEEEEEAPLSECLLEVMKKLGGVIIKKLDPCLQHPLLKNYIHQSSPSMLLQIMDRSSTQRVASQVGSFSDKQKVVLRSFLAGLSDVTEKDKRILQELTIFEQIGPSTEKGTPVFTALKGAKALHHTAKLPTDVRLSMNLVDSTDEAAIRLIKILNVEQVKSTECLKVIVQDIVKGFYTKEEVTKIMLWVLKHLSFLKNEDPSVIQWISSLKFIYAAQEKPVAARDLFDPELDILQDLFYREEKTRFPPTLYISSPDMLHSLRQLGLKNEVQLTEKDVVQVAHKIEELQSKAEPEWEPLLKKAKTLLTILNKQTKLVKSSEVQVSLQKLKWVPVCKDRPLNYPLSLAWMGDSFNICSFSEMCDISYAVLVGSSVALVERTSAGMKKALKLSIEPQVDQVLQHLKAVNDWHKSQAFTTEDWYQFQQILFEIYDFMQAHLEDAREAMKSLPFDWVWTGKTFSSPSQTVLKPISDLDLQPYLYSLPKTMAKFHKLFEFCGSIEEVVPSHVFEVVRTIRQKTDREMTKEESKHNLLLLINILRWLYNNQISVDTDMHVPILCYKDPSKLVMKPIHECSYCDIKVDDLNDLLEDVTEPIILVHDDIPMKTAEWLKVPCLSTRLINPENLGFEQSGQREPLTVRIKNILEEYPSVSDIFKELLQNADDANATECSFLIDMRKNLEIRENLLDPGMAICHGPALWSFNNSVFSDTDFLNITRLGGSMKRCEADKVGKFGLGFNSVYHVTDIPIIMSREFMIMFDPNINHISKHIRDKSNPGIKINWSKQQKRLRKFPNQFKPFVNVFNCQLPLSQESPYKYNGTLFRLPFRTELEASVSEISTVYYNTTDIYSLVDEFSICGHRLILFTQHVGSMVLKYLKYEEPNPAASQDVVTINKSVWSSKAAYGPLSILKTAAKVMKKVAGTNRVPADIPKSGCIIRIVVEEFHNVFRRIVDLHSPLFRGPDDDPSSYFEIAAKGGQAKRLTDEMPQKSVDLTNWLICSCMDVGEALKFSLSESGKRLGLVPCGGVAVLLSEGENRTWTVKTSHTPIGEVFCYLPLRIKTGLPVHINGCFAVTSNRKEIWKTDTKGNWNSIFMRHVIVQAYLAALSMMRSMAERGELVNYNYYAAWPDPSLVHDDFTLISQGVYQEIAKGGDSDLAKVFSDGKIWVSIKNVRFLDDSLLCRSDIGSAAFKIFLKYLRKSGSQDLCAVELPDWVKEGFDDAGCKGKLMENTLTEQQFFSDVFFPHIQDIDKELRDPLMHYVLNEKLEEFAGILKETPCIPCSGSSHELVVPSRLIHPEGRVAKLYNFDDGRFPDGTSKDYLNPVCLVKLVQLGMDELQHLKNTEYNITTRKSIAENVYKLKAMLLDVGFNLVYSCEETASLYFCLEDAGIPVRYVTPEDVRSFLLTFSSPDTACQVGKLPCRLQQSNFKLFHSFKLLVDYCFKDVEEGDIQIEGLPLLITMDNMLQVFDSKRPKFLTTHHELISTRKELFMNTLYMRYSKILMKSSVAKVFDISSFGDLLGSVLPREYRTRTMVKWKDNYASESWLKSSWHFISENIAIKDDQTDIKPKFETVLDILKDWALLPGIKFMVSSNKLVVPECDVLLPLSLIYAAIFPNGQNDKVFHTLMKGGCIQLALNKVCTKENPVALLLAQHAANIENPSSILKALAYMIQTSAFKTNGLTDKDFEALLLYFNCNLVNLSQEDVHCLKLLPCYKSHQEKNSSLPLIRFSGSQVNPKFKQTDIMQLLWTSCPILPEKATPASIKDQEGSTLASQEQLDQVLTMLNVNLDPPLDKVISNCKNICSISNLDDDMVKTRNKVLRSTYEFLNADKRDFRYQLRGVSFVMVEEGWKLLKPEEVVINLDNESDFKPYLYKLPLELGTFHQLFKLLGTEDVVSTKQYVEVLYRIYRNSEGKQLDPNEMRTVKRAVSGLFKSLQNDPVQIRKDLENLRDLTFYLPSHDGKLAKSNLLVFDDAPHYKSRIQGNVGVQMLVDLSQCYLGKDHAFHTKMIMLLPQKLRPRLLSSILEEQLDEESPKMCQFGALCSLQGRLQLLLSSEQFITGLIRIMKHENDNAFLVNEEKAIRLCKALCEGLKVSCFEKLQTTLRVKGCSPIPHSKSETLAFLKRYGTSVIHLYIQHSDSKDINFLLALAMTLKSATDNLISDTSYLIAMLGCNDIYRITEKLDNLGVKYDSTEPSKLELPLPGTPIPAEIHHILLMDPMNVFYPGEYVGYLVDSEGGDIYGSYHPTYTYAIIVQEVEREEDENPSFLGKCFQIDIGYSEYKIVSSLDLYKFSRQDESTHIRDSAPSTPTSPSECSSPGPRMVPPLFPGKENHRALPPKQSPQKLRLNALPEILKEVTSVIEQAWKLPETERKKIIRRLYLKWHPDKNAENLEIATEVFKHLQNEISRMEKQSLVEQTADRTSRRPFSTSARFQQSEKFSFQRFYTSWNQEATSHKSEKQQFREQYSSFSGSSHSNRYFVPPSFKSVGNPVEARRWLRQARANFSAARNDLHKNANEWVCFKCYLATKLALIAADYAVRGKSDKDVKPTALAQKVEEYNSQLAGLAKDVNILEGYGVDSLRTRYPDLLPFPQIPNDRAQLSSKTGRSSL